MAAVGSRYTRFAYRRSLTYHRVMKAVFVELPAFERHRADYLDDDAFRKLQSLLMLDPEVGDMILGTGALAQDAVRR